MTASWFTAWVSRGSVSLFGMCSVVRLGERRHSERLFHASGRAQLREWTQAEAAAAHMERLQQICCVRVCIRSANQK